MIFAKLNEIMRKCERGEELTQEEIRIMLDDNLLDEIEAEENQEEAECEDPEEFDDDTDCYVDDPYQWPEESRYAGTYVHDVVGWSDEMIDDVLEGDTDAYWNID